MLKTQFYLLESAVGLNVICRDERNSKSAFTGREYSDVLRLIIRPSGRLASLV